MSLLDVLHVPESHVLEENYVVLMETHLPFLRTHPNTQVTTVSGLDAARFIGDFNGLLDHLGIDKKYHYLITRVNHLQCSNEYDGSFQDVVIPDTSIAAQFLNIYTSLED